MFYPMNRVEELPLVDELHQEFSRQQEAFERFIEYRSGRLGIDINAEDRFLLQKAYLSGLTIQEKARNAPRKFPDEIRKAVERAYGHEWEERRPDLFYSVLTSRETGRRAHANYIEMKYGTFYGEANSKTPGGPFFSDVKLYILSEAQNFRNRRGGPNWKRITISECRERNLTNQNSVKIARIVSGGYYVVYSANTIEFTILMGTTEAKSNAFFADQLGCKISAIAVIGTRERSVQEMIYCFVPKGRA